MVVRPAALGLQVHLLCAQPFGHLRRTCHGRQEAAAGGGGQEGGGDEAGHGDDCSLGLRAKGFGESGEVVQSQHGLSPKPMLELCSLGALKSSLQRLSGSR